MPEISVVMPVFSGEEFLSEAIESIQNQTFQDYEFIVVVEEGSSEESVHILEQYALKNKKIKLIFNEERLGISESLNIGLRESTGKYIARMDADDISGPKRFEIQKLYLDTYPDIGVVGTFHKVTNSPNWLVDYVCDPELIRSELLFFVPMRHPTIMFRCELTETCSYDKYIEGVEDYDFYYQLSKYTKLTNISMPELFTYRRTGMNASYVFSERDLIINKNIEKKVLKEMLSIEFKNSDMDLIQYIGATAYKNTNPTEYSNNIRRLDMLLYQIEMKNRNLGVFRDKYLRQTLQHRWSRELYKLKVFLNNKNIAPLQSVWAEGRYFSPWF